MASSRGGGVLYLVARRRLAVMPRVMLVMSAVISDMAPRPVPGVPLGLIPPGRVPDILLELIPLLALELVPNRARGLIPPIVPRLGPEMMPGLMPHMMLGLMPDIVSRVVTEMVSRLIPAIRQGLMPMPCPSRLRQQGDRDHSKGQIAHDRFHYGPSPFALGAMYGRLWRPAQKHPRQLGTKRQTQRRGGWGAAPG